MPTNRKSHPLHQSPFYKLRSRKRLAAILGTEASELRSILANAERLYSEFEVPKRTGEMRPVENPSRPLKLIQARIARLLSRIEPPNYLFCPVKGRCYVTNAAQHRGQRVVRCLDIRKYFPNTPSRRVFWFFRTVMQCDLDIAAMLARLATYKGHLPTGSPLSPIMAYFAYYDVWQEVASICLAHGYRLTVYIDDVTISGARVSASRIWEIKRVIHRAGLRYHKEKVYVGRAAEITGVIVNGDRLMVPNRQLKKLVQTRRELTLTGDDLKLREKLTGLLGQMRQIAQEGG